MITFDVSYHLSGPQNEKLHRTTKVCLFGFIPLFIKTERVHPKEM
jgi:hypothetical protein